MDVPIRSLRALCASALAIATCADLAGADVVSRRVRPVGERMISLLARGEAGSRTLAALVDALERSDVIVHVDEHLLLDGGRAGETLFVTAAGGHRYLRIYLDPRIHDDAAIAILGHELQHAWEIAHARWVVNQSTLVELYEQIGYRSESGPGWYGVDTRTAQQAAREVRRELQAFRGRLGATD